jgi:class 3 adenylate cyclase
MNGSPVKRRLAAIMSIDVVSYSAMMGADEEGTMRVLRGHRAGIDASIRRYGGRIANTAGDSVLAEFGSPVEAVRSALDIQTGIETRNGSLPESRRMQFRIGVHLDDVIVQDNGDLLGEGVNIAARLQGTADPGGVMVSGEVAGQARAKLPEYGFERLGQPVMKNIVRTVEAFRVVAGARAREIARADVSATPGTRRAAPEKKQARGLAIVIAVGIGLLGGAAAAWGLFALLTVDASRTEEAARRKAAEAEAARKQASEAEAVRKQAAEAARQEAARQEAARKEAAAAEAARQRQEQEAAEHRHTRATMTRSLAWSDIDCAKSRIAAGPGMSCAASAEYDGVDGRGKFRRWAAGIHAPAASTYVVLVDGVEPTSVHLPLKRDDEGEFLVEISTFTRDNARDWSPLTAQDGSFYATFKAPDGRACFAFAKPGPARGDGLAWVMRGYHCTGSGQPLTPERIAGVIGALKAR